MGRPPHRLTLLCDGHLHAGLETSLVTFLDAAPRALVQPTVVHAGHAVDESFARAVEQTGTPFVRVPAGRGRFTAFRALWRELAPDIVHVHSCGVHSQALALATALRAGARILRTVHMPYSRWEHNAQALRSLPRRALQTWLLRRVEKLIAVSEADRRELLSSGICGEAQCVTVPNGIALDRFTRTNRADARARLGVLPSVPLIGAVGRLTPQKRFHLLLEAMPRVLAKRADARLVVIGTGPDEAALVEQSRRLGFAGQVLFAGHRQDVAECLPAFDVLAMPSLYESQGLVMVEALAARVPVVASDLPCFHEIDGHRGAVTFCDVTSPQALADAVLRLLGDAHAREHAGLAGNLRARHYSAEAHAAAVCALYDEHVRG